MTDSSRTGQLHEIMSGFKVKGCFNDTWYNEILTCVLAAGHTGIGTALSLTVCVGGLEDTGLS